MLKTLYVNLGIHALLDLPLTVLQLPTHVSKRTAKR